ncbi:hypothetical protein EDD21DRAFT_449456 [Dissophora ornata]|nr:hypothetical protein EDD21DRAFT_449456 [Dissophora ornata]
MTYTLRRERESFYNYFFFAGVCLDLCMVGKRSKAMMLPTHTKRALLQFSYSSFLLRLYFCLGPKK